MKISRYLAAVCAAAALMVFPVSAAAPMTPKAAETKAEKLIPAQSEKIQTEEEDGIYGLRYYNKNCQEWYIVRINKQTGKIVSFDSSRTVCQGGREVVLTDKDAQSIVTDENQGARIEFCELEEDGDSHIYRLDFSTQDYYGTYMLDAESGTVLTRTVTVGSTPIYSGKTEALTSSDQETAAPAIYIGTEKAKKLALTKVPGAEIEDCQLVNEDGRAVYNGAMHKGYFRYDFSVDAITGTMVRWEISNFN